MDELAAVSKHHDPFWIKSRKKPGSGAATNPN
jgi:hypothetical protein